LRCTRKSSERCYECFLPFPVFCGSLSVDWALRILREIQTPLPAEALIDLIAKRGGPEIKKPTLVSNLSRYVQHGDTFTRPAPNTYGLVEFADQDILLDEG
jgi:hypothetical protein